MKNFINKLLVTGIFIIAVTASCNEDNIELEPVDPIDTDYFVRDSDFENAIIGVYSRLVHFYALSNFGTYGGDNDTRTNVQSIMILPGDDITTTGTETMETFNFDPYSPKITHMFASCYALIRRACYVLSKIESAPESAYTNTALKNYHKGEALFLRSFGYYLLWNVYGTAPLVTETIMDQTYRAPSSTGTQLLDQAIIDLTEAAGLLPASWPAPQVGRVTANAANGLLGKCLVFRASATDSTADYQTAIQAFDKISGVALIIKWDDNFAFDTENNAESLFEFQASINGPNNPFVGDPDAWDAIGVMSSFWGFYSGVNLTPTGYARWVATQKLADAFDPADPRKNLTMNAQRNIQKYGSRDRTGNNGSFNNPRILRYADVLLLKAEAILKSGGDKAVAIGLINEIRTRARNITATPSAEPADRNTSETSDDVIIDWIKTERFLELAGEGQRWFDLRRWYLEGQLSEISDPAFFSTDALPTDFHFSLERIYLPIPYEETKVNPNIIQNAGY